MNMYIRMYTCVYEHLHIEIENTHIYIYMYMYSSSHIAFLRTHTLIHTPYLRLLHMLLLLL